MSVDAIAATVVLDAPVPENVNGFRMHIASQVVKAAKGKSLDWTIVKDMLTAGVQTTLGGAVVEDKDPAEAIKDEGVSEAQDGEIAEEAYDKAMETTTGSFPQTHRSLFLWAHDEIR